MFSLIKKTLLVCVFSLTFSPASAAVPEIGALAPELKGTLFSGDSFDLSQMRGKVVLINFYSSYCKFCAYEIGNVETYQENNVDEDFVVIVVGVDSIEDRHRVERMVGIYNLRGLMADELEQSGFANRYVTPTTFLVDRQGILRSKSRGAKMPAWFRKHVDPLLAEPR